MWAKVALFLLCALAPWRESSAWQSHAWPASNRTTYAGSALSGTVRIVTGSIPFTNAAQPSWSFIYSNAALAGRQPYQPSNGVWSALVETTNIWVKTYATNSLCEGLIILTNSVISTQIYANAAGLLNPGTATFPWSNTTNALDCALTNVPQLIAEDFTRLKNIAGTVTNDYFPATNLNLGVGWTWTYDSAMAAGERADALNITRPSQTFAVTGGEGQEHNTVADKLPAWKTHILATATNFAIRAFADSNGLFNAYVTAPQTGRVWRTHAGQFWSYDGATISAGTNHWGTNVSYRLPPVWTNTFYRAPDGTATQTQPDLFTPPLSLKEKLAVGLGHPIGWLPVLVTNTGTVDGWRVGADYLQTSNVVQVATNWVSYGNYFDFNPKLHHATMTTNLSHFGEGQTVLHRWNFFTNATWLTWGTQASNVVDVLTNQLTIPLDTRLNVAVPYWSNNTWQSYQIVRSNSAFTTLQALSFTNWLETNIVGTVTNVIPRTNTASVAFAVWQTNWANTNAITNAVAMARTNLNLLALTATNAVSTNVTALYTNWPIAAGFKSGHYEFDGVRTADNELVIRFRDLPASGTLSFFAADASTNFNRYGSNIVASLIDTALTGLIVPPCAASNTLAEAGVLLTYSNANNAAPFATWQGTTATNASCGYFRKDVWHQATEEFANYIITAPVGCEIQVCTSCTPEELIELGPFCTDPFTPVDCATILPGAFCSNDVCYVINAAICEGYASYFVTNCTDLATAIAAVSNSIACGSIPHDYGWFCGDNPFIDTSLAITMWQGAVPADVDECCSDDAFVRATKIDWHSTSLDLHDSNPAAYGIVTNAADALSANIIQAKQSGAGLFTDTTLSFTSDRQLYAVGTLTTPGQTARWYNTNALPVQITFTITTNIVTGCDTNMPDACALATFQANAPGDTSVYGNPLYTYQSTVTTWPTWTVADTFVILTNCNVSGLTTTNVTITTNALWSTRPQWDDNGLGLPVLWDDAGGVPRIGLLTNTLSATNWTRWLGGLTTNAPTPAALDDVLKGYGVGAIRLLENFSVTNGFPHQENP